MPLDLIPTSVVKSAKRTFTAPIVSASTFDAAIATLRAEDNPLGASPYQSSGETIDGVVVTKENYKATVSYVNPLGKVLGNVVITAPNRDAYDTIIAELLATSAITTAYGADATASRETNKDSWSVRVKVHDPTGEIYFLTFTQDDLRIASYEADALLTKVEIWADGVTALN